jgi:excisionase family DNA binding protein
MYLTATQVGQKLGISMPTVFRLLGSGAIPGRRVGHQWRISEAALERFFDAGEQQTTEAAAGPVQHAA